MNAVTLRHPWAFAICHEGHLVATPDQRYHGTGNASTLSRHYAHPSPSSMMASVVKRLHNFDSG
jgi:hypothetical protein